jgi:hypothetical protein
MKALSAEINLVGEAPEQLYHFDGGADLYSPTPGYAYALAEPRSIV